MARSGRSRTHWKLPKTYKPDERSDGHRVVDGEPIHHQLRRYDNDRTLTADAFVECCDCGLTHHYVFNVRTSPDGSWWLMRRAYRVPNTGK